MKRARVVTVQLWLALLLVLALVTSGCRSCGDDKSVAEVKRHQGVVTRDTAATQQKWEPAADGAKLALGDGLKTGPSSEAIVKLTRGGTLKLPPETIIRFLTGAPGGTGRLAVEAGEASIEAEGGQVTVETSIGVAHIESGGTLRIAAGAGGSTRFEVSIGSARIDMEDGGVALAPGKAFEIALGGAIVEREIVDAGPDVAERADAAPPPETDAGAGAIAVEVHGKGVRVQNRGGKSWLALAEGGGSVAPGDTLDVPGGASVDLRRGAQHGRLVGAGKYVVADGDALVAASAGKVELETSSEDVVVNVPGGVIVAKSGGRMQLDVGPGGTKATTLRGEGEVRGKTTETLRAGESATMSTKGVVATSNRGPERPDFTANAGESLVIRDPRPPTALAFDFSSVCSGGAGVLARGDASIRGEKRAALFFPPGHHTYTIRCIGPDGIDEKPAATGTVDVIADAARADLPRLPPSTVVDMDGRRYTVMYQNLLPAVVARWQDAPPGAGYVLHVDGQTFRADAARHALKAGSVGEGSHVLWFETADGAKKSAETTLVIKFDNASPAASVREPEDGSFKAGDSVKVAGVVVEGWTVSVNGQPTPLDEQRRFSTTATAAPGENAIVIRLTHPQRGTVHYVRHAGGAR